jgi:hypothetical protein
MEKPNRQFNRKRRKINVVERNRKSDWNWNGNEQWWAIEIGRWLWLGKNQ